MIYLLRKYSKAIVWVIVIVFVGTMFTGTLLRKSLFSQKPDDATSDNRDYSQEIAMIGNEPINPRFFSNALNQITYQIYAETGTDKLDPEFSEYIALNAFNQAFQRTCFLIGAKEQKLKATKQDLKSGIAGTLQQYNLKDEKELKALLKKNNYPYKKFIENLKEDIIAQKFATMLTSDITVTDKDVENSLIKLNLSHILIKINPTNSDKKSLEQADKNAQEKAYALKREIFSGMPFEAAAQKYSEDIASKIKGGNLGWVGVNDTPPQFEKAAYTLGKGEVSDPVRTQYGYHLIKMLDKQIEHPKDFNFENAKKALYQAKQNQIFGSFMAAKQAQLKIYSPQLLAIKAKQEGKFIIAENYYQNLVSKTPASPVPHYLLARLYLMDKQATNNLSLAKTELDKAMVKVELNPATDFPELHTELAIIYTRQGKNTDAKAELNKAYTLSTKNLPALEMLKKAYQDQKDAGNVAKLEKDIALLKHALSLAKNSTQNNQSK